MAFRFRQILLSTLCALALGVFAFALAAPVTSAEAEVAGTGLGLVYLDRSEVGLGDVQSLAVLAEEDAPELAGASLTVARADGSVERSLDATKVVDGAALMEFANDDASLAGDWRVTSVTLRWADGTETVVALEDSDDLEFALAADPVGTTFTSLDEDGEVVSSDDLDDVAAAATGDMVMPLALSDLVSNPSATTLKSAVVALDPGHGGYDSGAGGIGFYEKDANWAISMATKDWLEARGVKVFLTHAKDENGGNSEGEALDNRVARAVAAGACVLVSQHNNSTPSGHGFEIYIPVTSGFNSFTHEQGKALAELLAPKLRELGLTDRGIQEKYYSAGSSLDWYGIIRRARSQGLTCILVEHAFVDNPNDAALLRDPEFLRRLGEADAEAIYGRLESLYRAHCEAHGIPYVGPEEEIRLAKEKIDGAVDGAVFRLFNEGSDEHLYTADKNEATHLVDRYWNYEGVEWVSPATGEEVYRLYNPYTLEHLYTTDVNEYEKLGDADWIQEGVKLHMAVAATDGAIPVFRLYNTWTGRHLFTTNRSEYDALEAQDGWDGEGVKLYGLDPSATIEPETPETGPVEPIAGTPILGESETSREALQSWFARMMVATGKTYPAIYADKGAATPEAFVNVLWDEATDEGVRPDVLLAQVIHETGWLQFTGLVPVENCNFGGLGATDDEGNRMILEFPDVSTGLRAQTQHLRAYADATVTQSSLANPCVDLRFDLVTPKGKAPTVEELSRNWSSSATYGQSLVDLMKEFPNDLA